MTEKDLKEFQEIEIEFGKNNGLTTRRNRIVHAVWSTESDQKQAFPLTFSRTGKPKIGDHTTAEMIEAVTSDVCIQGKKLQKLLERLNHLQKELSFQLQQPPLPEKHG